MLVIRILLYPFTIVYSLITLIRNYLYDIQYFKSYQPTKPFLINVGNLTVGGTGKTPHVEMLIRRFSKKYALATLSRGYGRKTKGFRIAQNTDLPTTLGDEPYQLYQKFSQASKQKIVVTVGEKRVPAVQNIIRLHPEIDLILLDDAFQHRAIQAHFNILLTDFGRLFYKDLPFPSGLLRESRQGARRADAIIISKCPIDLPTASRVAIKQQIQLYASANTPIFFTGLSYQLIQVVPADTKMIPPMNPITVITGIAHAKPLLQHLETNFEIEKHCEFPDHHHYTIDDLQTIEGSLILTTEKDWTKLSQPDFSHFWVGKQVYLMRIEVCFLEDEAIFWDLLPYSFAT